jgi:hypothetical protein
MTKPVRVMAWGGRTKGGGCCCGVDNADASTVSFPPMGVAPNDAVPLSRGGVSAPFSSKSPINRLRSAFAYDTVFVEFARTKGRRFGISSTSAACKHKKRETTSENGSNINGKTGVRSLATLPRWSPEGSLLSRFPTHPTASPATADTATLRVSRHTVFTNQRREPTGKIETRRGACLRTGRREVWGHSSASPAHATAVAPRDAENQTTGNMKDCQTHEASGWTLGGCRNRRMCCRMTQKPHNSPSSARTHSQSPTAGHFASVQYILTEKWRGL